MFFIGIFGVEDKQKHIGTYNNTICPSCGVLTKFEIYKTYTYFHIFFIPTFRWNVKYIVKPSCCGRLYALDPIVGKEFGKNPSAEIRIENLQQLKTNQHFKFCANCKIDVPAEFSFCPYCGEKL